MKTYKCEYTQFVNDRHLDEEIDAESHREAYEKFLENHGTHNAPVYVTSGIFGSAEVFKEIQFRPMQTDRSSVQLSGESAGLLESEVGCAVFYHVHLPPSFLPRIAYAKKMNGME